MSIGDLQVRLTNATMRIRANRTMGILQDELEVLEEYDFKGGFAEYWSVALSQEMTVKNFIYLLEGHLLDVQQFADEVHLKKMPIATLIAQSIREARNNNEQWFIEPGKECNELRLRPQEAALWLLQRPLHADRLPSTLREFLSGPTPKKQGEPQGRKISAVIKWLRQAYPPTGVPPLDIRHGKILDRLPPDIGSVDGKTLGRAIKWLKGQTGQV